VSRIALRAPLPLPPGHVWPTDISWVECPASADDTWWQTGTGDIEVLITPAPIGAPATVIARMPALRMIAVFGVGLDAVDFDATRARGLIVTHTPGVLTESVADAAMAMVLAGQRRLLDNDRFVRAGLWGREPAPLTRDAYGARLGIIGMGRIGQAVARRARGFSMEIGYTDPAIRDVREAVPFASPEALAARSDILVVACPASAATVGLVSQAVLSALGPAGLLVNIARGDVVDEPALIAALESGALGAAALDVFTNEPAIDPRLLGCPNLLLSPHVASATMETRRAMAEMVVESLRDFAAGRPVRHLAPG